jgi:hypothetical protein
MKYPTAYNEDYGKQTAVTLSVFGGLLLLGVTAGQGIKSRILCNWQSAGSPRIV